MKNKIYFIAGFFFLYLNCSLLSQSDTLLMLNGNRVVTNVVESNDEVTRIKNPKKPSKTILLDNDRIFSITNTSGETLIYGYDTTKGNDLTVEEMRIYIIGEQDAQRGYKPRLATAGGALVGAAAGITGSFLAPIVPFAYSALLGIPKVKVNKKSVSDPELLKQDVYLMGYQRVARKKRNIHSLISGGAGLVAGFITYSILKNNNLEPL